MCLLIFNVKEGWEPLCKFLNKDVPKALDFPRGNTTKDKQAMFKAVLRTKNQVTVTAVMISVAIIGCIMYGQYKS